MLIFILVIVAVFTVMGIMIQDSGFRDYMLGILGGTGSTIYLGLEGGLIAAGTALNSVHPWLSHAIIIPATLVLVWLATTAWAHRPSILHRAVAAQPSATPQYQQQLATPELYASAASTSTTPVAPVELKPESSG